MACSYWNVNRITLRASILTSDDQFEFKPMLRCAINQYLTYIQQQFFEVITIYEIYPFGLCLEPLLGSLPVDNVPDCTKVLSLTVLVLEAIVLLALISPLISPQFQEEELTSMHAPMHQYPTVAHTSQR